MADNPADQQINLEGGISNPELSEEGKVTVDACETIQQAWSIYKNHEDANRERNRIMAKIVEVYNGKQLETEDQLRRKGQAWRSNFPSLFMRGIIDQVIPTLTSYIENSQYLTQSKLKDSSDEGMQKTEKFRKVVTKTIRKWSGWRPFYYALCKEIFLIGYAMAGRTDEYEWRPTFWRQDQARVSEGTPQFAKDVQVLTIEQDLLLNDAVDIVHDKDASKAAGWNRENMIAAVNKAMPKKDDLNDSDNPRKIEDAVREGNIGTGHSASAKVIKMGHVLPIETGEKGKVTHWIVNRDEPTKELFHKRNRFKSISDIVTLFTLDLGNLKFYGSIGLGKLLANYDRSIDFVLNATIDNVRLSSLLVLQHDSAKGMPDPKVKPPILWVSKDAGFDQKMAFQAKIDQYILVLNELQRRAQLIAQKYVPSTPQFDVGQGEDKQTATGEKIDYAREQQSLMASVSTFSGQWGECIGAIQRTMFNSDTNDEDAKAARKELKSDTDGPALTDEEIDELANSAALESYKDPVQDDAVKIQALSDPEWLTSPFISQMKRQKIKLTAEVGADMANEIWLPEAIDPISEVENLGEQIGETEDILSGASRPVSPRNLHKVHLDSLIPDMQKGLDGLTKNPETALQDPSVLDHHHTGIVHGDAHIAQWEQQGASPQEVEPYKQALADHNTKLEEFGKQLLQMKDQQEQQAQEAQMQEQAAQQPPVDPNQPVAEEGKSLPMTEKIAVALIGQYDNLEDHVQTRLLQRIGLLTEEEAGARHLDTIQERRA